jgi:hypothetical protein
MTRTLENGVPVRLLTETQVRDLSAAMKRKGISNVRATYNGGNDEGFIETTVTYYTGLCDVFSDYDATQIQDSDVADVVEYVCMPIEYKYESWDGDFESHGFCEFNQGDDDVHCQGQETDWVDVEWP